MSSPYRQAAGTLWRVGYWERMPVDEQRGALSAESAAVPPRVIANRYELRDRIGRGAFGEVFEAYDRRLHRLVALKIVPIGPATDADAAEGLRRFCLEAQSVARLSHPGIVTVHDFGEAEDFAWIVMELVIGETLKAVLDRGERPELPETVRVVCALLDALHYAHGRGIVHRDVKPANVLLAIGADEGLGEVRLTDFGIARIGDGDRTVIGQMLGTPSVMSPEQLRGEPVDHRADLWSVGVILYELLTGTRPFPGGVPAIFHSILTHQPKPPSEIVAGLPPAFDVVIATALAKAPADRYPDAAAMAAAVRAALAGETPEVLSRRPGVAPQAGAKVSAARDATGDALPMQAMTPAEAPAPGFGSRWASALCFLLGLLCGGAGVYTWMTWEDAHGGAPPIPVGEPPAGASEPAVSATPSQE